MYLPNLFVCPCYLQNVRGIWMILMSGDCLICGHVIFRGGLIITSFGTTRGHWIIRVVIVLANVVVVVLLVATFISFLEEF